MRETAYTVPFIHVPYGSKVVIYGGGKWGEHYYRKIKQSNCAEIVAVLDVRAKNLPKIYGKTPVYEPDKIVELQFDYVCITVEAKEYADDMREFLRDHDVPNRKILWSPRHSYLDERSSYEIMKCFDRNMENKGRRFFLFMLPEHGNLGDYAIGYAEYSFFKQYFSQYAVCGITTSEWLAASEFYMELIRPDDVIFLNGGGFWGDLRGDDKFYEHIVESFPRNIKIFFPNSLTYQEKPGKENKAFMEDIKWFEKQDNLFIFFREYPSYHLFHQYEKRCYLFPDMALRLCFEKKKFVKQNRVLLCLRGDQERIFDAKDKLENSLKNAGIGYDIHDIFEGIYISQQAGRRLLEHTIRLFQSYDCVITDRLHGMILAITSNVPCIAFDNYTHKISGVFSSVKDLGYVKLLTVDQIDVIDNVIDTLYENRQKAEAYRPPEQEYKKMADMIYKIMDHII